MALPVLRLTGLYLALSTLAFGQLMDKLVFQASFAFGFNGSLPAERLSVLGLPITDAGAYVVLMTIFFVLMGIALLLLRRGRLGRILIAMRDSPAACGTLGLNMRWFRVGLFGLSAGMAGLAGALFAGLRQTIAATDFQLFASLPLLLLAVVCGVTSVTGAAIGGVFLMLLPVLQSNYPGLAGLAFVVIGFGAVALGRDPNGMANLLFALGGRVEGRCGRLWRTDAEPAALPLPGLRREDEPVGKHRSDQPAWRIDLAADVTQGSRWRWGRLMPLLEVDDVVVQFGGVTAVDEATFALEPGRVTGLIGPNGAGKTTCFNVITGLQKPTQGPRALPRQGRHVRAAVHRRAQRGMARTFQRLEAFGSLTVRDNVRVALDIHHGLRGLLQRTRPPGSTRCSSASGSRRTPTSAPTRSPPAPPGCSSWPEPWPASRGCCCSTSPPRASTRSRPTTSATCCASSPARAARCSWWSTTWTS